MPRKKKAKPEEIAAEFVAGLERIREALLKPGAPKAIEARIAQLEDELQLWEDLLETHPRQQLQDQFHVDMGQVLEQCGELSLRFEDLVQIRYGFAEMARALSGEPGHPMNPSAFVNMVVRAGQPPTQKVSRFKPAFQEAFRRQEQAKKEGKSISARDLAKELTPYEYKHNPASAIRSMQSGIKRVAREHDRCRKLGIPSPFLPPVNEQQN